MYTGWLGDGAWGGGGRCTRTLGARGGLSRSQTHLLRPLHWSAFTGDFNLGPTKICTCSLYNTHIPTQAVQLEWCVKGLGDQGGAAVCPPPPPPTHTHTTHTHTHTPHTHTHHTHTPHTTHVCVHCRLCSWSDAASAVVTDEEKLRVIFGEFDDLNRDFMRFLCIRFAQVGFYCRFSIYYYIIDLQISMGT